MIDSKELIVGLGDNRGQVLEGPTLSNQPTSDTPTHPPAREEGGDADLAAAVPGAEPAPEFRVTRNTTRFEIDLRAMSDRLNAKREKGQKRVMGPEEKELRGALENVARLATTARNVAMRANERRDAEALDRYLLEHGAMPRKMAGIFAPVRKSGVDTGGHEVYSYPLMRRACPELSTNMVATLQKDVDGKWVQERYDVLVRQTRSRPHFKMGQPFPIPAASLNLKAAGDSLLLSMAFYSQSHEGTRRFTVPMRPRDDHQTNILARIASGEWKHGQAVFEQDRLRPWKWYVRLAYKRLIPKARQGIAAGINRGCRAMIAAWTETGEAWIYDGQDIEAYLKQMQARRRRFQNASKASGRHGHGRARMLRPTEALEGKAQRYRQTRCQVIARRLARWLFERHVNIVYIEDFGGIRDGLPENLEGGKYVWDRIQEWPYSQLQMRLVACLEELGIEATSVSASYISQTCPACGHTAEANRDWKFWRFKCTAPGCKYRRHLDVAAAQNVCARGKATTAEGVSENAALPNGPKGSKRTARKPRRK